jgi:hypothetical protein
MRLPTARREPHVGEQDSNGSVYPDSAPVLAGAEPPGAEPVPVCVPVPMLGQSLVEPEEDEPVAVLEGVGLVELVEPVELAPEEFEVSPVPDDEPVLPLVLAVEPVVDVLVAALATSAPPVTSPAVSAPTATALRR